MTAVHDAAQSLIERVAGAERADEVGRRYHDFLRAARPVVTVFGAFDTGKTSLVRRLLVDAGVTVPEWATISARHETYEVNSVTVGAYDLVDTPGLAPEATDARGESNSAQARAAAALTDVLLVVLTPQLATGERPELVELLTQPWPRDNAWFVIARFDEAGADPTWDPDGYAERAEAKTRELRQSLQLDDNASVFVVTQDFAQLAGDNRNPPATTWDESRPWDGIDQLSAALKSTAAWTLSERREHDGLRYYVSELRSLRSAVLAELGDLEKALELARQGQSHRDSWSEQLETLVESAATALKAVTADAIASSLARHAVGSTALQAQLATSLDSWWASYFTDLERLGLDIGRVADQQRERPTWSFLADLYADGDSKVSPPTGPKGSKIGATQPNVTTRLTGLGDKVAKTLKELGKVQQAQQAVKRPSQTAKAGSAAGSAGTVAAGSASAAAGSGSGWRKVKLGVAADVTTAVLPLITELSSLIEDLGHNREKTARDRARRDQLKEESERAAQKAAETALSLFEQEAERVREAIIDATAQQVDAVEALEDTVTEARAVIGEIDTLGEQASAAAGTLTSPRT